MFLAGLGGLAAMAIVAVDTLAETAIGRSVLSAPVAAMAREARASIEGMVTAFIVTREDWMRAATPGPTSGTGAYLGMGKDPGSVADRPGGSTALSATPSPTPKEQPTASPTPTPRPTPTPEPRLAITGLRIPSIGLETKVVPAEFVEGGGGGSWQVPAFVAGHAEFTAGAGAVGNAVLLGHVDSLRSGDVFHDLERVSMGDVIEVWSGDRRFDYRVVAIWSVPRTDGTVMQPTPKPSLSLITCTGRWLPLERDFSHRLVVRAELVRR